MIEEAWFRIAWGQTFPQALECTRRRVDQGRQQPGWNGVRGPERPVASGRRADGPCSVHASGAPPSSSRGRRYASFWGALSMEHAHKGGVSTQAHLPQGAPPAAPAPSTSFARRPGCSSATTTGAGCSPDLRRAYSPLNAVAAQPSICTHADRFMDRRGQRFVDGGGDRSQVDRRARCIAIKMHSFNSVCLARCSSWSGCPSGATGEGRCLC